VSKYFRDNGEFYFPTYEDGRTKQSFADECDINKILKRAEVTGSISHLEKHGAFYADVADAPQDIFEARAQIERVGEIFSELPAEVRKEFRNDPLQYLAYVNDPANQGRIEELIPAIAEPEKYFESPLNYGSGDMRRPVVDEPVPSGSEVPVSSESPVEGDTGGGNP
jgi:phage internal scaffolding protein